MTNIGHMTPADHAAANQESRQDEASDRRGASMEKILRSHHEKKLEECSAHMLKFYDYMLCRAESCDALIDAINNKLLVESGNKAAEHLRAALCLSIDIQRTEDAIVTILDS